MIGWMMIFAFFALLGTVMSFTSDGVAASISQLAAILFGTLFVLSLLTRVVRGRI